MIIEQIGLPATLEQLAEECCELGQAALKYARALRKENPTPKSERECREALTEETADVLLCIDKLNLIALDLHKAAQIMTEKEKRWDERLKEAGKG